MDFDYASKKLNIKPGAAQKRYSRLKRAVFTEQGQGEASKRKARGVVKDGEKVP